MSDIILLEALQTFLIKNVASQIKLQKANNDNVLSYELVNPQVQIGWIPSNGYLPAEMEPTIPCIIVGSEEGVDDGREAGLNIRLLFAVFSPGKHEIQSEGDMKFTPDFEGYLDLLNLKELAKQELARQRIIEGTTTVQLPFKWGMYQEQPYPYWYGWLTFKVSAQSGLYIPSIKQQYL